MGFAQVGSIPGGASTGANTRQVSGAVGSAATTGRVVVVAVGKDNSSTASGDNSEVTSVNLRNSGDTTTKLSLTKFKERTNAAAANASACCSMWWGVLPSDVASTDIIIANFASSIAAKTLIGEIFSVSGTVSADPQTNASEVDGGGCGSLAVTPSDTTGSATNGRLVIRAAACEDNEACWATATSTWTNFTEEQHTASGGAAANMAVRAEFKIGAGNTSSDTYTSNPGTQSSNDNASVIGALYEAVSGANTLTCTTAAYSITGTAAVMAQGYKLPADTASYALTGTAAVLAKGKKLAADTAGYAITGTAVAFGRIYVMAANAGSYAISGTVAALKVARLLVGASGSYALNGTAAALVRGKALAAGAGSYALTGTAAAFPRAYKLAASAGSYALTGTAAALKYARLLAAAAGSYAISGTSAALKFSHRLVAAAGSYTVTGTDVSFKLTRQLAASAGSYAVSGAAALFAWARRLVAGAGSYSLTGTNADLIKVGAPVSYTLSAASGVYTLTGVTISLTFGNPQIHPISQPAGTLTAVAAPAAQQLTPVASPPAGTLIAVSGPPSS